MLWGCEMQLVDVFQLVTPDQVRHIRASKPANLALFFNKVAVSQTVCRMYHPIENRLDSTHACRDITALTDI